MANPIHWQGVEITVASLTLVPHFEGQSYRNLITALPPRGARRLFLVWAFTETSGMTVHQR